MTNDQKTEFGHLHEVFFLYKKRKNIFSSLRKIPTVSVDYHHIILKKRDSNRAPLDVRKLNEEFFRLENQLAGSNIRMRLASLAQNEINTKHTRFKDIGIVMCSCIILLLLLK